MAAARAARAINTQAADAPPVPACGGKKSAVTTRARSDRSRHRARAQAVRGPRRQYASLAAAAGCLLAIAAAGGFAAVSHSVSETQQHVSAHPSSPPIPVSGPGTFTTAQATGEVVGVSGPLHRYEVQVEDGSGVSAEQAAAEIQAILAHPRSWAAHGGGRFQLVPSGADVTIRIATPKTADKLCAPVGDTKGEFNCEVTEGVVVNLKRWLTGSPKYDGPPDEYRHLIINHEVGHMIGYTHHMGCPGAGKPAPVMQQQIKSLDGCKSNAWPYAADGTFITGPTVP
ncbi:DUF3152 domain-containing protein [Streptomyces vinaceus]